MKVCMVNDCAYVGETLLRYFPEGIETKHIKRTRGMWDKTFGIAWKILRAKADLYHVHYALQDAYITLKTKKEPVIVHAHGSDCRSALYDWKWGRIVKYDLKHASKVLLDAPDVLDDARKYASSEVECIPIPIDFELFSRQPIEEKNELTIFAPYMRAIRGTDKLILAFSDFEKNHPNSKLVMVNSEDASLKQLIQNCKIKNIELIKPAPHEQMPALYEMADIVVSDLNIGYLSTCSLEAMAVGRPLIQYIKEGIYSYSPVPLDPPIIPVESTAQGVLEGLEKLVDIKPRRKISELQHAYVKEHNDPKTIVKRIMEIYEELLRC